MGEFIYGEVQSAIKSKVSSVQFLAITCDETTSVDNGSWLSVHAYVYEDWTRVPHLIALSRIQEAPTADHLIPVIVEALEKGGGVGSEDLREKLLCFGADGVTVF
jgi:hypothetical protein